MLPRMLARMLRRGHYRKNFTQRFGRYAPDALPGQPTTWIHSVSVGETLLALRLADELHRLDPATPIVLSVTTSTGYAVGEKASQPWLRVIYNPIDFPPIVHAAFRAIRPARILFIEAVPWPNIAARARRHRIPLVLVNARISPRSERRYRAARRLVRPLFEMLDLVCLPDPDAAPLWRELGTRPDAIAITGSIKYDQPPGTATARQTELKQLLDTLTRRSSCPVLLAGSTFPGEETHIVQAFIELRKKHPDLFLIIAPRHVERTDTILRDLAPFDLPITRRSTLSASNAQLSIVPPASTPAQSRQPSAPNSQPSTLNSQLLLLDTTGELRDWYALATVVFIGKSLTSTGGQNPVEAVLAGAPVVFGPHMENFAAIVRQWLAADAAVQVPDAPALTPALDHLLSDSALRAAMTARAQTAVSAHRGATARTAALVLENSTCHPAAASR